MGKFNFGINSSSAANEELGDNFYSGDTPPKGVYTCLVKQFKIKKNKNDDFRLSVLLEIQEEDDSDKAKYNGYGFWGGYNVVDEEVAKRFINNMLDGIGAKRKDFWDEKMTVSPGKIDKDTAQDVLKIGARKTTGHMVRVATKFKPAGGGYDESLEPARFLTDEDVPQRAGADVEPDDEARGLDDAGDTGDEAAESEGYTEEELDELDKEDLQTICKDWDIKFTSKTTVADLRKLILAAQEEADDDGGEDDSADESAAEAQSAMDEDALTEEDLEAMDKAELIAHMNEKGWDVPSPAVPSRMRKAIMQFQAEPPF